MGLLSSRLMAEVPLSSLNKLSSRYLTYRIPTRQSFKTVVINFFLLNFPDDSPSLNEVLHYKDVCKVVTAN